MSSYPHNMRQTVGRLRSIGTSQIAFSSKTTPYRLVEEVGGVCLILYGWDEGSLGACQVGPVQALEPGVQLDLARPSPPKPFTGVQLQQAVHQVLALC